MEESYKWSMDAHVVFFELDVLGEKKKKTPPKRSWRPENFQLDFSG